MLENGLVQGDVNQASMVACAGSRRYEKAMTAGPTEFKATLDRIARAC